MNLFFKRRPKKCSQYSIEMPHVRWWLALTAPQIYQSDDYFDIWLPGMKHKNNPDRDRDWKESIQGGWGLDTDDDWFSTIQTLVAGNMHGQSWSKFLGERSLATATEWQHKMQSKDPIFANEMAFVDMVYRHVDIAGFRAWDYCRGGFLIRSGYHLGVLNEDEWAFFLNYLAREARYWFSSWEQYCQSYLYGYNVWSYMNNKQKGVDSTARLLGSGTPQNYAELFQHINDGQLPLNDILWDTPLPDIAMPVSVQNRFSAMQAHED